MGVYGVVNNMFRYIIIIIYEIPTEVPIPVAYQKDRGL